MQSVLNKPSVTWKLVTPFDPLRHLFSDVIQTNYLVETYICGCGRNAFIVKDKNQQMHYCCEECGNDVYCDANFALQHISSCLYSCDNTEKFVYEYKVDNTQESVCSLYGMKVPSTIDFVAQKVSYTLKPIYTVSITQDGEIQREYHLQVDDSVRFSMERNLLHYMQVKNPFSIPLPKELALSLESVCFFLQNKHLKEFDFYFWDLLPSNRAKKISIQEALMEFAGYPQKKSLKRAVYKHYTRQMDQHGRFNAIAIALFCKTIEDSNIAVQLLDLELDFLFSSTIDVDDMCRFVLFLKGYYSEKQLVNFFSSHQLIDRPFLFDDMLREFLDARVHLDETFHKVSCKPMALHDEFVRCTWSLRYRDISQENISYTPNALKPCVTVEGYEIRVPLTGEQLIKWAESLHNCMAGHFYMIVRHETLIYCFFEGKELKFAVEIANSNIVQASGKYNRELTPEENRVMQKWYKQIFTQIKGYQDAE